MGHETVMMKLVVIASSNFIANIISLVVLIRSFPSYSCPTPTLNTAQGNGKICVVGI
jgi:hypothetical protein